MSDAVAASTEGYIRSVAYPDHFHREQAPIWTAAVMAALGHAVPGRRGTRWCEIGCGQGFVATLLAAVNPEMQFHGIDINPDHIQTARARAAAAGLTNVSFECADIRDSQLAGAHDFITCFGVLSWVDASVRGAILRFVGERLAPGGVATLHYMAEPGGAMLRGFHSVFRALRHHADPLGEGFRQLDAMRKAEASFFQLHAAAGPALDLLKAERRSYVAHEYLNPDFNPLPFHQIEDEARTCGLEWRGSANGIENIDAISLPEAAAGAMAGVEERVLRETLKDLARNQTRRIDLFTRPRPAPSPAEHVAALDQFIWGLLPGAHLPKDGSFTSAIGPVSMAPQILGALYAALARAPQRFGQLMAEPAFAGRAGLLNQTLQVLLWAGIAHPVLPGFTREAGARLNSQLLAASAAGADIPGLAAPVLGSGLDVTRPEIEALLASRPPARMALLGL